MVPDSNFGLCCLVLFLLLKVSPLFLLLHGQCLSAQLLALLSDGFLGIKKFYNFTEDRGLACLSPNGETRYKHTCQRHTGLFVK